MKKLLTLAIFVGVLTACASNPHEKCKLEGTERNQYEVCEKV
jgi:hypothetical protein